MGLKGFKQEDFDKLREFMDSGDSGDDDSAHFDPDWKPPIFKPRQQEAFDSKAPYVLVYGERHSGKTFAVGHKVIDHLWNEFNALAAILVGVKNQAMAGGIWHKLMVEIIPQWEANAGLKFIKDGRDDQKNPYIDVTNRHQNGKSRVLLISAPYPEVLSERIRGYELSMLFFEEATTVPPVETAYFSALNMQLGRRKGIRFNQQYVIATNPAGPSHWIYRKWIQENHDNPDFDTIHVPMEEGREFMPKGYYEKVVESCKSDEVLRRRLLEGEWVDQPDGDAIFADYFFEGIHVRGDIATKQRIIPNPEYSIILGWDSGSANNAIQFLQRIVGTDGVKWVHFDEMIFANKKMQFSVLVPALIRRMHQWNEVVRKTDPGFKGFHWEHISDEAAFNQYRQTGSYDFLEIQNESRGYLERNPGKFPGIEPFRMRPAPKPPGSKKLRVTLLIDLLEREQYVMDAHCVKTRDMFYHLQSEDSKKGYKQRDYDPDAAFTPKRSKHIHGFDALTYPIIYHAVQGKSSGIRTGPVVTSITRLGVA
jgi:hypothetical protein